MCGMPRRPWPQEVARAPLKGRAKTSQVPLLDHCNCLLPRGSRVDRVGVRIEPGCCYPSARKLQFLNETTRGESTCSASRSPESNRGAAGSQEGWAGLKD